MTTAVATYAYAAKRALFTVLDAQTDADGLLVGVQVAYEMPGQELQREAVIGGNPTWTRVDTPNVLDDVIFAESITVPLEIRLVNPAATVEEINQRGEALLNAVATVLQDTQPGVGQCSWWWIVSGADESSRTMDEAVATIPVDVAVRVIGT